MDARSVDSRQLAWQVHAQKLHMLVWLGTQIVLHELTELCHIAWETVVLLGLWHCALAQEFDAYKHWTLVARRYFSLQIHAEEWGRIRQCAAAPPSLPLLKLLQYALVLGSPNALTILVCAAMVVVNVARWYYSMPVETVAKAMDPYAILLYDWALWPGAV
ncbi:hypothetical protein FKP32DRAFT_1593569 [Trametes sanguinea]|nr:hypothetical protein FKP32DRAFT_1593569 [Trametes sanguinea]